MARNRADLRASRGSHSELSQQSHATGSDHAAAPEQRVQTPPAPRTVASGGGRGDPEDSGCAPGDPDDRDDPDDPNDTEELDDLSEFDDCDFDDLGEDDDLDDFDDAGDTPPSVDPAPRPVVAPPSFPADAPVLVLMPGLDGTGTLFAPFLAAIPAEIPAPVVVRYPDRRIESLDRHLVIAERAVPRKAPYILVAESFSGPLAILHAAKHPPGLRALVLCATFAQLRIPVVLGAMVRICGESMFLASPPTWGIRAALTGDAPAAVVASVRAAIKSVHPGAIHQRLYDLLDLDVTPSLADVDVPVLCLVPTEDRLVGEQSFATLAGLPRATTVRIAGPHLLLQTRPTECVAAIAEFVRTLCGTQSEGRSPAP